MATVIVYNNDVEQGMRVLKKLTYREGVFSLHKRHLEFISKSRRRRMRREQVIKRIIRARQYLKSSENS